MSSNGIRIAAIVVAVGLVVAAVALRGHGSSRKAATAPAATTQAPAPAGAVVVTVAYSPEKDALLQHRGPRVRGEALRRSRATRSSCASRTSPRARRSTRFAAGTLKPTIWSPSSSLWGRLLTARSPSVYVGARDNPSIVRTPLVIAIWEPVALALGWPAKPLGFADVAAGGAEPAGLRGVRPSGVRAPSSSATRTPTSRRPASRRSPPSTTRATGKTEGLTPPNEAPAVRAKIRAIESSVVHYGDTTLFFADQLARHGPAFASAVAMEEATLHRLQPPHAPRQPSWSRSTRRRARSSPTTPTSC